MRQACHNWGDFKMRVRLFTLSLILAVASSFSPALAGPKEDLMNTDRAFSAMSIAKGSNAAFLFYMADDGRIFGIATEPPIYGKDAAAKRFAEPGSGNGDPATNVLSWSPEYADVSADGTVGWTDGSWAFVGAPNAKGERPKASGHYLTVWKKDAQGQWKIESDMGTMNPAPK